MIAAADDGPLRPDRPRARHATRSAPLAYLEEPDIDTREVRLASRRLRRQPPRASSTGPSGATFYDDRFDMFPDDVSEAHQAVVTGGPTLRPQLDRLDIDLVTVPSASATRPGAHHRPRLARALRRRHVDAPLPPGRRPRRLPAPADPRCSRLEGTVPRQAARAHRCRPARRRGCSPAGASPRRPWPGWRPQLTIVGHGCP